MSERNRQLMLERLRATLKTTIRPDTALLETLWNKGAITRRQLRQIKQPTLTEERNGVLLTYVGAVAEGLDALAGALAETGQEQIVKHLLKHQRDEKNQPHSKESAAEQREAKLRFQIQRNKRKLKENVEATYLLASMISEGIVTEAEAADIRSGGDGPARMQKLLHTCVYPKGLSGNLAFLRAIKSSKFSNIAREIENTKTETPYSVPVGQNNTVYITISMFRTSKATKLSAFCDIPNEVISAVKRTSKTSITKMIMKKYNVKREDIASNPSVLKLKGNKESKLEQIKQDCLGGELAKSIWEKLKVEPFFKGHQDSWKVILDVDYDFMEQAIAHINYARKQESMRVTPGGDDHESDASGESSTDQSESEDDLDEITAKSSCCCSGDGSCIQSRVTTLPGDPQTSAEVQAKLSHMINTHVLAGRIKRFKFREKEILEFLQSNSSCVQWSSSRDTDGLSALHRAVMENRPEVIRAVYDAGLLLAMYDLKVTNERSIYDGYTPLQLARQKRCLDIADQLQTYKQYEDSMNCLHRYARVGDLDAVKKVLLRHVDLLEREADDGSTALFWAVTSGSLPAVQYLVNAGSDVFDRTHQGCTLLTRAVRLGKARLISYLIRSCGLDPDKPESEDKSPVIIAIELSDVESLEVLIDSGATVGHACLPLIARVGNIKILEVVLKRFTLDINYQDRKGRTPMMCAAEAGNMAMLRALAERGAEIDIRDKRQRTVLHSAAESGDCDILKYILQYIKHYENFKDLLNMRDRYVGGERCFLVRGRDSQLLAYHYVEVDRFLIHIFREITANGGSLDVAKYGTVLKSGWGTNPPPEVAAEIERKYDVTQMADDAPDDLTPLCLAILKEKPRCALMLIEAGCDVTMEDRYGLSPLHLAAMRGMVEVVAELERHGADLNAKDRRGRTVMQAAEQNKHTWVLNVLTSKRFCMEQHDNLKVFEERMLTLLSSLGEQQIDRVMSEGKDVQQYIVSLLLELTQEINGMFVKLGTSPITEASSDT